MDSIKKPAPGVILQLRVQSNISALKPIEDTFKLGAYSTIVLRTTAVIDRTGLESVKVLHGRIRSFVRNWNLQHTYLLTLELKRRITKSRVWLDSALT